MCACWIHNSFRGNCVNATQGQKCTSSCDPGFRLVGSPTLTCNGNKWSPDIPSSCEPVRCENLTELANGTLEGQCIPGIVGSGCGVKCAPGFKYDDARPSTVSCMQNGSWSGVLGGCIPVVCSGLLTITNGAQSGSCQPGEAFKTCTFSCQTGWAIFGQSVIFCNKDGQWSGEPPKCVRLLCPSLKGNDVMIASGQCDPGYVGDTCMFACQQNGYRLNGSKERLCQTNMTWSGQEASCVPIKCPPFKIPANMAAGECTNEAYSTCEVKCTSGFRISDGTSSLNVTCNSEGKWVPSSLPFCSRITCPPLSAPNFGEASLSCLSARVGEHCYFRCLPNYKLIPDRAINTCQDDGRWMVEPAPHCVRITCTEKLVDIDYASKTGSCVPGLSGDNCVYNCFPGFALAGTPTVTCTPSGQWSKGQTPRCVPLRCLPLEPPTNGRLGPMCTTIIGSTCEVICNEGYAPQEPKKFVCTSAGSWSVQGKPSCKAITCMSVFANVYSKASGDCVPGTAGKKCDFACTPGYRLSGSGSITCLNTGQWSEPPPECILQSCPSLQSPRNGYLRGTCGPGYVGRSCVSYCSEGFKAEGNVQIVCQVRSHLISYLLSYNVIWLKNLGRWHLVLATANLCKGSMLAA